ncbi:MAG: sensor histidine kinase [Bacteroidia bacterium]|nr:sensor histidine kinase [Bacteroidia bacterium]
MQSKGLLICLWLFCSISFGQNSPSDHQREQLQLLANYRSSFNEKPENYTQMVREILAESEKANFREGIALARKVLGDFKSREGKPDSALLFYRSAMAIYQELGLHLDIAKVYFNQGQCYKKLNAPDSALLQYLNGLNSMKIHKIDHPFLEGYFQTNLGALYAHQGDLVSAELHYRGSVEFWQKASDSRALKNRADGFSSLGNIAVAKDNFDLASRYFDQAMQTYLMIPDSSLWLKDYSKLGNLAYEKGKLEEAESIYSEVFQKYQSHFRPNFFTRARVNYGAILTESGKYQMAKELLLQAHEELQNSSDRELIMNTTRNLGVVYRKSGVLDSAMSYFEIYSEEKEAIDSLNRLEAITDITQKYQNEKLRADNYRLSLFVGIVLLIASILLVAFLLLRFQSFQRKTFYEEEINQLLNNQEDIALEALLEGQEQTQNKIAQELHDNIGMLLSAVKLHFSSLEQKLEEKEEQQFQAVEKAKSTLAKAVKEVRNLSHDMLSGTLRHLGLIDALESLIDELNKSNNIDVGLNYYGFEHGRLPSMVEHGVYRISQELISNTLKHAKAEKIYLELNHQKDSLGLKYSDDGIGMSLETGLEKEGIGFKNIKARVRKLSGTIEMESSPGNGFSARIFIPFPSPTESWLKEK